MEIKKIWISFVIVIIVILGVLSYIFRSDTTYEEERKAHQDIGIANPSSVFCIDNGGKLEIRTDATGGQVGFCVFNDKTECEEWAYFRGECKPGEQTSQQN